MNILAIDTTGPILSLALACNDRRYFLKRRERQHDESLTKNVQTLLKKAGASLKSLDAIAVASGPGQFTGIRIGMTYAAITASWLKIPALALSRLEAAAFENPHPLACAALTGWKEEKLYQVFKKTRTAVAAQGPACWAQASKWPEVVNDFENRRIPVVEREVTAKDLLGLASWHLKHKKFPAFKPFYLKPASYERLHQNR